jgi:hypothetical protein
MLYGLSTAISLSLSVVSFRGGGWRGGGEEENLTMCHMEEDTCDIFTEDLGIPSPVAAVENIHGKCGAFKNARHIKLVNLNLKKNTAR